LFIEPGSPWENGYVESFNGKMRDELLAREIFYSLKEVQILIKAWRMYYNQVRPHSFGLPTSSTSDEPRPDECPESSLDSGTMIGSRSTRSAYSQLHNKDRDIIRMCWAAPFGITAARPPRAGFPRTLGSGYCGVWLSIGIHTNSADRTLWLEKVPMCDHCYPNLRANVWYRILVTELHFILSWTEVRHPSILWFHFFVPFG
jgi:hypothetical protein